MVKPDRGLRHERPHLLSSKEVIFLPTTPDRQKEHKSWASGGKWHLLRFFLFLLGDAITSPWIWMTLKYLTAVRRLRAKPFFKVCGSGFSIFTPEKLRNFFLSNSFVLLFFSFLFALVSITRHRSSFSCHTFIWQHIIGVSFRFFNFKFFIYIWKGNWRHSQNSKKDFMGLLTRFGLKKEVRWKSLWYISMLTYFYRSRFQIQPFSYTRQGQDHIPACPSAPQSHTPHPTAPQGMKTIPWFKSHIHVNPFPPAL